MLEEGERRSQKGGEGMREGKIEEERERHEEKGRGGGSKRGRGNI
jgi:hypothetical protein